MVAPNVALVLPANRITYEKSLISRSNNVTFSVISSGVPNDNYSSFDYQPNFIRAMEVPKIPYWIPPKSTARPVFYTGFEKNGLKEFDAFIVVEMFSFLSWQFARISHELEKKLIVITWETLSTHPLYSFVFPYCLMWRKVSAQASVIIAMSKRSKEHITRLGIDSDKTTVVYPGLDLGLFSPRSKFKERANQGINLLYAGLLERHKGFDLVLNSFVKAKKQLDIPLKLLVAGEGSLAKKVMSLRDESIHYFGKVPRSDMPTLYQNSDIFISPARDTKRLGITVQEEQFGFTIIEALASGLPIISTECGAIPEIAGNDNLIVDQDSIEDLVEGIKLLATKPDLRDSIAERNINRSRSLFDIREQSIIFSDLIRKQVS